MQAEKGESAAEEAQSGAAPSRPRRRWLRRLGLAFALVVGLLAALGVVATYWLPGREIAAPDWVKTRVMARIDAALPALDVEVSEIVMVVGDGWRPRVRLRHIDLARRAADGTAGAHLVSLAQAESEIALHPLMRGQVKPRALDVSGIFLTLRRRRAGGFDLQLDRGSDSLRRSGDLASLVEGLDAALMAEPLSALRRVQLRALTVQFDDRRAGRSWLVDGGRLRLTRDGRAVEVGGDFALLSGGAGVATLELNYASRLGEKAAQFGMSFREMRARDIAAASPALAWVEALRAPISGSMRTGVDDDGALTPLNVALQIGTGAIQPLDETRPIRFEGARAYFSFDPVAGRLDFDDVAVTSDWISAEGDGTATLTGFEDGWPDGLVAQLRLGAIRANPGARYETPVALARADLDFRMVLDPFRLDIGQLVISDQDGPLRASARLLATRDGWQAAADASAKGVGPARVLAYWPPQLKPETRDWIAENILGGQIDTAHLALRLEPGGTPHVHLGARFRDAHVRFMKPMPPIQDGAGQMTIEGDRLTVLAEDGWVQADQGGRLQVAGTVFEVPDITIKDGPAVVQLAVEGTVTAALSLLDREPFRFLSKAGQEVALADGQAEVQGRLDLMLKKDLPVEEVDFDITATARSVTSEVLVPGRSLTAPSLDIRATNETLTVSGRGRIGSVPFDGAWSTALGRALSAEGGGGPSSVTAEVELSEAFVREFNIGLPPGSVTGRGPAQITLSLGRDRAPRFRLTSALRGVGLRLDALAWNKPPQRAGELEVTGTLGAPPLIETLRLDAPGLEASGRVTIAPGGGLQSAQFSRVRAGNWLDAPVTLTGRGAGASPAVRIGGGRIDMRALPEFPRGGGGGLGGGGGSPISVAVDRLQVTEGIALTDMVGEFATRGGMRGEFAGRVNGGAAVRGRITPDGRRSAIDLRSDDAGAVFGAAGLLQNVRGGDLRLTLRPARAEGHYDGVLRVENTRLRDAPAMAALLNAISVVGLLEQLDGQGIRFAEVDAKFRLTPAQVIVTQSSAIGPSMGLSLDGYYNLAAGTMDFQGVLSPIYLLNVVGSVLTRKGEGLIGFNFQLKGAKDNPRVLVNPLSMLTPGMFREIFRRPPPKVGQ